MARELCEVVHQTFTHPVHKHHVVRGTILRGEDAAHARKHHPEKVQRAWHEFDDEPVVEELPGAPRASAAADLSDDFAEPGEQH